MGPVLSGVGAGVLPGSAPSELRLKRTLEGFGAHGDRDERRRALVAVALHFWTWQRLSVEGLDDAAAADLMASAVACC
jgi:hypothetical protein